LVDNAIVVYENIHRNLITNQFHSSRYISPLKAKYYITNSVNEIFRPILISNLTTVGAFLPILLLSSDLQIYIKIFLGALSLALLISFLVSFSIIPLFTYKLIFKNNYFENNLLQSKLLHIYKKFLKFCLRHKRMTYLVIIWLFGFPVWLLPDKIELMEKSHTNNDTTPPIIQNRTYLNTRIDNLYRKIEYKNLGVIIVWYNKGFNSDCRHDPFLILFKVWSKTTNS
jgi:multidrug efflux pump subunit AcrB